jgi:acetylornithine deacetylase
MNSNYTKEAVQLLSELITTPSFSTEEGQTADLLQRWLQERGVETKRQGNNIFAFNKNYDATKPHLLLCSHHDTVKPNKGYTRDPFVASIEEGRIYGLGSNDAGGCLVALLSTFVHFYQEALPYNLVLAAVAEEENAGEGGIRGLLPELPEIDLAIIGEPTLLDMAIAEKGLIVYDAVVKGTPSHAAHPNTDNALYNSIAALEWLKNCHLPKVSDQLGPVKVTATQIQGGKQHNVVPSQIELVIDVRVNDCYSNEEIDRWLQTQAPFELTPRSLRLSSSNIPLDHPLIQSGIELGYSTYGSPTLSDQAALSCPSLKFGPGDSTRSHSADEYLFLDELDAGIHTYITLLTHFFKRLNFSS